MTKHRAGEKDPSTQIRLPLPLMQAIDLHAQNNGRSRNTEILMRLQSTLEQDSATGAKPSASTPCKAPG